MRRLYSRDLDKSTGLRCDQTVVLTVVHTPRLPRETAAHQVLRRSYRQDLRLSNQPLLPACLDHRRVVPLPLAGTAVLQVDQAAPAHQGVLRYLRKRGQELDLDRHLGLRVGGHH